MRYARNEIKEKRLTKADFKDAEIIDLWPGKDDITEGKFVEAVMKEVKKSKNEQEATVKLKNKQVIRIDSNELISTKKGGEITWP